MFSKQKSTKDTVEDYASNCVETGKDAINRAEAKAADAYHSVQQNAEAYVTKGKDAVNSATTTVHHYYDESKKQVDAAKKNISKHVDPYVTKVKKFDITKTSAFSALIQVTSCLIFYALFFSQYIPLLHRTYFIAKGQADELGVTARVMSIESCAEKQIERIPVVGARSVSVSKTFVMSVQKEVQQQWKKCK